MNTALSWIKAYVPDLDAFIQDNAVFIYGNSFSVYFGFWGLVSHGAAPACFKLKKLTLFSLEGVRPMPKCLYRHSLTCKHDARAGTFT